MDLLSPMALRGHWGLLSSLHTVPAKTPPAPSVLFIKYTEQLCGCVCVRACVRVYVCVVGIRLWLGRGDLQEWETHVTVTLWVFV